MPLKIMAVAISRKASILLPGSHSRNVGKMRLRIMANITTNTGRLPMIVETKDTGPLFIAQNDNVIPIGANVSLKAIKTIAEFLCGMLPSCLRIWGRTETSRKIPDTQNAVRLNMFQNER